MPNTNLSNILEPVTTLELVLFHPHPTDEGIEAPSGKMELLKITQWDESQLGVEHSSPAAQFVLCLSGYFLLQPTVPVQTPLPFEQSHHIWCFF